MIYVFLATGFEEVEALTVVDICRRAALQVNMVSVCDDLSVVGAHGISVHADSLFDDNTYADADLLFLPGGMPGADNLRNHAGLCDVIVKHYDTGKPLAAICAAPFVYGELRLLKGVKVTCYPGFENKLDGAKLTGALVEKDGQFMTGKGPGAAFALGYMIVEHFCGAETADALRKGMIYEA